MTPILISFALLAVLWFVMIVLPQRRRIQAHTALLGALEPGDRIMSTSGIYGTLRAIGDETVDVEIADGITVTLAKGAIASRINEGVDEPAVDPDTEG